MIVRPRLHWFRLLFVWRGSVLPQIVGRLVVIFGVSVASVALSGWWLQHFPQSALSIPPFTLMGGLPEALRVFGGVEPLDDLLESLSAAVFNDGDPDYPAADAQPRAPS